MPVKFSNNAAATLAAAISATSTSITVTTGMGAIFPAIVPGEFFFITLIDSSNNIEYAKVTARAGDTMTAVRGQDGTAARAYLAADRVILRINAAALDNMAQLDSANTFTDDITFEQAVHVGGAADFAGAVSFDVAPTAPTPTALDNSTKLATTAYVDTHTTALTGDATGSGTSSIAVTLANSGVTAGSYGSASQIPVMDVDVKGRVTNISTASFVTVYPGTVITFAGSTPPTGYLEANGAAVSRTTYAALFAVVGITYGGGDGTTTFNLPDLRGEFIRGWDHGRNIDTGRTLGSAQTGTSVQIQGSSPFVVRIANNTENPFSQGSDAGGWSSYTSASSSFGYVRPRNVALLMCIKF